jgi:outer membrane protein assembly factor BamB
VRTPLRAAGGALILGVVLLPLAAGTSLGWLLRPFAHTPPGEPDAGIGASASGPERLPREPAREPEPEMEGIFAFRGGPLRDRSGEGPVPKGRLRVLWRAPVGRDYREPQWNGIGWTGQPLIVRWPEATRRWMNFLEPRGPETEVIAGGMDGRVHFYDAESGRPSRPPLRLPTPNPIKGTVSLDPDGVPLLGVGSALPRSGAGYRVYSLLDFSELLYLPGHDRAAPRRWPAFDGNGLILDDRLYLAGENGLFYSVALNTRWESATGELAVRPKVERVPVSSAGIESSAALWKGSAYCGDNRGGLWRIGLSPPHAVRKLVSLSDDVDSTVAFDPDGCFYVGREVDLRHGAAATGTVYKLRAPDGEVLWRWDFPAGSRYGSNKIHDLNGGILSTPAVWPEGGLVFVTTAHHPRINRGSLVALDRETGQPRWTLPMRGYAWSSPAVVDGAIVAVDVTGAVYVRDAATGRTLLKDRRGRAARFFDLGGTVESSPVVWRGRIYLGVRGGALVAIGADEED